MEKEAFYFYENGSLGSGAFTYIMRRINAKHMIDKKEGPSQEKNYDRVSRDIRTICGSKQPVDDSKNTRHLMYAAGTLLAVIILVVGATMLSNYDQMKNMQNTINHLSDSLKEVESVFLRNENSKADLNAKNDLKTDIPLINEGSLNVEVIPGGVSPLPDMDVDDYYGDDESLNSASDTRKDKDDNSKPDDVETSAGQDAKAKRRRLNIIQYK